MKLEITARHFFQAPLKQGYVWASCDYSSQELRCAGALSNDRKIIEVYKLAEAYEKGKALPKNPEGIEYKDPYADQHLLALSFVEPEIKKNLQDEPWKVDRSNPNIEELRTKKGKVLNFKTIYGGSAYTFALEMGISEEEAKKMLSDYFKGFPQLETWLKTISFISTKQNWIPTATGRKIFVAEANAKGQLSQGTKERKGCNGAIQSLSASMTKLALPIIQKKFNKLHTQYYNILKKREAKLINATHDEINAIVPGNCKFEYKKKEKNIYELKIIKNSEDELARVFGKAIQTGMIEAENIIFKNYLNSDMPSGADLSIASWWKH